MEAASGHFLRDVFGRGAQVRSWWDECSAWLWPSAPGTTVPRRPRAETVPRSDWRLFAGSRKECAGTGVVLPCCVHPFIFLLNEAVLRHVCSHVHHALINYLISLFLSKRWWTFKSQIKLWSRENSSLILILITMTYTHQKPALEMQHALSSRNWKELPFHSGVPGLIRNDIILHPTLTSHLLVFRCVLPTHLTWLYPPFISIATALGQFFFHVLLVPPSYISSPVSPPHSSTLF